MGIEFAFSVAAGSLIYWITNKLLQRNIDSEYSINQNEINHIANTIHKKHPKKKLYLNTYEKRILSEVILPEKIDVTFDQIGGLGDQKSELYDTIISPLLHPEIFASNTLAMPPKGVMLYGPPVS